MAYRLFVARVIFPLVFLALYAYVSGQLFRMTDIHGWQSAILHLVTALPFLMLISLPYYFWDRSGNRDPRLTEKVIRWIYVGVGYFSYLLFFILLRDVITFTGSFFDKSIFLDDITSRIPIFGPLITSIMFISSCTKV